MKSIIIVGLISALMIFITGFTNDSKAVALDSKGNLAGIFKAQGDNLMSGKINAE